MLKRLMVALALMAPVAAMAQPAPVKIEIVATGAIDAPATSFTLTATWQATGKDEAAAKKAQADKQKAVRDALQGAGVPAAAVTIEAGTEASPSFAMPTIELPAPDPASSDDATESVDEFTSEVAISDTATITVKTLDQVQAVRVALAGLDISVGAPTPQIDNIEAVRRQAKAKALSNARADAGVYAVELGLKAVRVTRISEAGNGMFLPGLQDKFQQAIMGGPQAMKALFESKPGVVRVEATIIVEFTAGP